MPRKRKNLCRKNGSGTVVYLGDRRRRPYAVRVTVGWKVGTDGRAIPIKKIHVFQIFYANLFKTELAIRWKKLLPNLVNSSTINANGDNYINQELEIDAFVFTKFYLKEYEHIDVQNKIEGLDKYLDLYIMKNRSIL